ncbi:translationally-controlled tumor protein [Streptomyces sp. NBC_00370]|uniref:translationally-controlled tumor protein n=1 Tax=Streptomyces sp. NBC_00370 TaxID=2975728 RepID=UPI002E267F98
MKVYKDVLGYYQDELFSDAFPIEELAALYAVTAKSVTKDLSVKVDIGASESAEDGGAGAGTIQVIDLVDTHRLQVASLDKRSYMTHLKKYLTGIQSHLGPGTVEEFKKTSQETAKAMLADFDSYTFYQGENLDAEGMVAFARPAGNDTWTFNFWKPGVRAEQN